MSSHYSRREDDGAVVFHVVPAPYPTGSKVNKNGARTMFMGMILSVPMVFVFFIGIPMFFVCFKAYRAFREDQKKSELQAASRKPVNIAVCDTKLEAGGHAIPLTDLREIIFQHSWNGPSATQVTVINNHAQAIGRVV